MFDIILKGGNIYDGGGKDPFVADIGLKDDRILKIGDLSGKEAREIIDVSDLVVSPGFINMLSWSVESLIHDGRALATIKQGVTLEVMGESISWGPVNDHIENWIQNTFSSVYSYDITWKTLGEYLQMLEEKGVSTNIASFVGSATVRAYAMGEEDREPSETELDTMKNLVAQAMEEGAMGLGSALIYPPACYADTRELVELCKVVAQYDGMYISHIRSEGANFESAVDELLHIAREASLPAEIYHLKASGKDNWHKMDLVIDKINKAREEGLYITTDCYTYTAAGTGLGSCLPPWVSDGGHGEFLRRLKEKDTREKIREEMALVSDEWENLYIEAGPKNIYPNSFKNQSLKQYSGKSIEELSTMFNKDPRDTIIDLLIEDEGWIGTIYEIMNEANIEKKIQLPYMSFGSDGESMAAEGLALEQPVHPRAYGNFARLLSRYVRDRKVIPLQEAIHKLTYLPASNLKIKERGLIKEGYYADLAIFDLDKVQDRATFQDQHQLSEGMVHVFVNGVQVLHNGQHSGATPGRFIKGPGYSKK